MELNEEQLKAVNTIYGNLLVKSGAGTGKTTVVANRVENMIKNGIPSENILVITYTNAAADEMFKRIVKKTGDINAHISTFHIFVQDLVRTYGDNKYQNFLWANESSISYILRNTIIPEKHIYVEHIPKLISLFVKLDIKEVSFDEVNEDVVEFYKKTKKLLGRYNKIDFSEIMNICNDLLDNEDILTKVRDKYKYIIIDEFQDINNIQYEIIKKIAGKDGNLCVVGDENQSIYGFNGGNIDYILNFENEFNNVKTVNIKQNYRCSKTILDFANESIKQNIMLEGKELIANKPEGDLIGITKTRDLNDMFSSILNLIKKRITKNNGSYMDHAILCRNNYTLSKFKDYLDSQNVPNKFNIDTILGEPEIENILLHLKLFNNEITNNEFLKLLSSYIYIYNFEISKKCEMLFKKGYSNMYILKALNNPNYIVVYNKIMELRQTYVRLNEKNCITLIREIILLIDMINSITIFTSDIYKKNKQIKYSYLETMENVKIFIHYMNLIRQYDYRFNDLKGLKNTFLYLVVKNEKEDNAVSLYSGHKSKGLEFKHVYILQADTFNHPNIKLDDDLFFYKNIKLDREQEIFNITQEERRLWYVMVTRAKDTLDLFYTEKRHVSGLNKINKLTPFVVDISKCKFKN